MVAPIEVPVGQRFGELVILGRAPRRKTSGGCHVFVRCDCGAEQRMTLRSIRHGVSRCNTQQHFNRDRVAQGEQIMGRRFGLLTVISSVPEPAKKSHAQVKVRCDCGAERMAVINHLMRGQIRSCGGDAHKAIAVQAKRWSWKNEPVRTYVIEATGTGLVKIGQSRDMVERLRKMQYQCPVEMRIIAVCDDNVERRLHTLLDAHRAHGEWFRKNDEVMGVVLSLCHSESIEVLSEIGTGSRGAVKGRKYKCKRCGELGHFAKTCSAAVANLSA